MSRHSKRCVVRDVPVGLHAKGERIETDLLGDVSVPADRYWGGYTQRSLAHASPADAQAPKEVYHAYGIVKKAAALVNLADGRLDPWKASALIQAADEVIAGALDEHFPLLAWQEGSGTLSNMCVNEVIANRAIQLVGGAIGSKAPVHLDDVNGGLSFRSSFVTAMHLVITRGLDENLLPHLGTLTKAVATKAELWMNVARFGSAHAVRAVPNTVGQQWSVYATHLRTATAQVEAARAGLLCLPIGRDGYNGQTNLGGRVAAQIATLTGKGYVAGPEPSMHQSPYDAMLRANAGLRSASIALAAVAGDTRLFEDVLASTERPSEVRPWVEAMLFKLDCRQEA